jgi:hypothetical protein
MRATAFPYVFAWKNGEKWATLYGRRFRVIARGKSMNTVMVEFQDGQREVISRQAMRRVRDRMNERDEA